MRRQKAQEEAMQTMQTPQANEETASKDLLKVLSHLATIVTENGYPGRYYGVLRIT